VLAPEVGTPATFEATLDRSRNDTSTA